MASSLGTFQSPRLPYVQSAISDPALQGWLRQATTEINALHPMSTFSFLTPESNVTALPGTLGRNLHSGASVLWVKQEGSGMTGWQPLV